MPMINPTLRQPSTDPFATTEPVAATVAPVTAPDGVTFGASIVAMPVKMFNEIIRQRGYITRQEAMELWPQQPFDNGEWVETLGNPDVFVPVRAQAHDVADPIIASDLVKLGGDYPIENELQKL